MPSSEATGWLQFTNALRGIISGGQANNPQWDGLQILTVPQEALWDDPVSGTWIAYRQWTDTVPEWGVNYIPRPGVSFDEVYQQFLLSFSPNDPDPALTQAIRDDIDALQKTANDRTRVRIAMGREWHDFDADQKANLPTQEWLTFDQWKASSGYPEQQAQIQSIYDAQLGKFAYDTEKATDPLATALGQALTRYNNDAYQVDVVDPSTKSPEKERAWALVPGLATWKMQAAQGIGTSLDLVIDNKTSTEFRSRYDIGGNVNFTYGVFGFQAGGEYHRENINIQSNEFKLEVKSTAFTGILVTPSRWYDGVIGALYSNGPYKAGFNRASWFGSAGGMNQLMTTIYVAYQPTIIITLTEDDYNRVSTQWGVSAGISIFGFGFGASFNGANDTINTNHQSRTITLQSNSPNPQILAVLNNVLP